MCKQVDSTISYYMWSWALLLTLQYSCTELDNTRQTQGANIGQQTWMLHILQLPTSLEPWAAATGVI